MPPVGVVAASGDRASISPGPPLEIPIDPVPVLQLVAPSDDTRHPRGIAKVLPLIEPSTDRVSNRHAPASRRVPQRPAPAADWNSRVLKSSLLAVVVAILVVLAVWAATPLTGPDPNPGPGPKSSRGRDDTIRGKTTTGVVFTSPCCES